MALLRAVSLTTLALMCALDMGPRTMAELAIKNVAAYLTVLTREAKNMM